LQASAKFRASNDSGLSVLEVEESNKNFRGISKTPFVESNGFTNTDTNFALLAA